MKWLTFSQWVELKYQCRLSDVKALWNTSKPRNPNDREKQSCHLIDFSVTDEPIRPLLDVTVISVHWLAEK